MPGLECWLHDPVPQHPLHLHPTLELKFFSRLTSISKCTYLQWFFLQLGCDLMFWLLSSRSIKVSETVILLKLYWLRFWPGLYSHKSFVPLLWIINQESPYLGLSIKSHPPRIINGELPYTWSFTEGHPPRILNWESSCPRSSIKSHPPRITNQESLYPASSIKSHPLIIINWEPPYPRSCIKNYPSRIMNWE